MPLSEQLRSQSQEKHSEVLASLFLHFGVSYSDARAMRSSDVRSIFDSRAYSDWKKAQEARHKVDAAIIDRLDNVAKAIVNLGKVIAR
jgi:hypothetical protein